MSSSDTLPQAKDNTRLKKRLAIVGGAGLLLVGSFMLYGALTAASRAPYEQALARYKMVGNANGELTAAGSSLNASSADDATFEKGVKNAQSALEDVKAENELLSKEEALQTGEGKDIYSAFNTVLQKYVAYNADILNSMLTVRPIVYACTTAMNDAKANNEGVSTMRDCVTKFAAAADAPDGDYKQLADSFKATFADLADNLKASAALADPNGADAAMKQTLSDERDQIVKELSAISTTFKTNLQSHREAIVDKAANAGDQLQEYLSKKSTIIHF